jgi:hypothetical protein
VAVAVAVVRKMLVVVEPVEWFGFRTTPCLHRRFRSLSVLAAQQGTQGQFMARTAVTAHSIPLWVSAVVEQVDTAGITSHHRLKVTQVEAVVDMVSMETTSHLQQETKELMESTTTVLPSMAITVATRRAVFRLAPVVVALGPLEAA